MAQRQKVGVSVQEVHLGLFFKEELKVVEYLIDKFWAFEGPDFFVHEKRCRCI